MARNKNDNGGEGDQMVADGEDVTASEGSEVPIAGGQEGLEGLPAGAQLIINGQYIKDLSFENPNILRMMQASGNQPEISIDLGVNVQGVTEGSYEVVLQVRVETKRDGLPGFIVELAYAGLITLRGWPADQVEPILFIEGPKLLFPFARAIISNLTRDGGFPPLNLNPIDFAQLYSRRIAQQVEQAAAGAVN
jgi:preprotein translocase subunit SecB